MALQSIPIHHANKSIYITVCKHNLTNLIVYFSGFQNRLDSDLSNKNFQSWDSPLDRLRKIVKLRLTSN